MGREELLANVPIFSELSKRDLGRVAKIMVPRTASAGEVIIKENDQAAGFFIIVKGEVDVVRGADGPNPQHLATLREGDFFGEMALFEGFPRSATVKAKTDCELLAMTRWDFTAEMKNHPEIAVTMLPVLVRRLREVESHLTE
jgi:CRP-like cAMP-binding protein